MKGRNMHCVFRKRNLKDNQTTHKDLILNLSCNVYLIDPRIVS